MKNREITFGSELDDSILAGAEKIFKGVSVTLGSEGKYVTIKDSNSGEVRVTKDGASVAVEIKLENDIENLAVKLIVDGSMKTLQELGDGTTSTIVFAYHLIKNIMSFKQENVDNKKISMREYTKGMKIASEIVNQSFKDITKIEVNKETLISIATISSNNDVEMGTMVGEICHQVGEDGAINFGYKDQESNSIEFVNGYIIEEGLLKKEFINMGSQCSLVKPLVLVTNRQIDDVDDIMFILDYCYSKQRQLLIIASGYSQEVMATILKNINKFQCCPILAPMTGDMKNSYLEDVSVYCGAKFIDGEKDMFLSDLSAESKELFDKNGEDDSDKFILEVLGECEWTLTSKDKTVFNGNLQSEVEKQISFLEKIIDDSDNDVVNDFTRKRIAKLKSKMANVFFSKKTKAEMGFDFDRLDDALKATRNAMKNGLVAGAGKSYMIAYRKLKVEHLKYIKDGARPEFIQGVLCVLNSLPKLIETSLINCDYSIEEIEEIVEYYKNSEDETTGYNTITSSICSLVETGVLESSVSGSCCFNNAMAISKIVANIGCAITDVKTLADI